MHTFAEVLQLDYLRMIVCKQIIVLKTLSSAVDFDTLNIFKQFRFSDLFNGEAGA